MWLINRLIITWLINRIINRLINSGHTNDGSLTMVADHFLRISLNLKQALQLNISLTFTCKPLSSTSASHLRSTDRLDHFVPHVRTALAQCQAFPQLAP